MEIKSADLLRNNFLRKTSFTSEELDMILERGHFKKVKKRKELFVEGSIPQQVIYVLSGLLRMYVTGTDGKIFTLEFAAEDSWMADLKSVYGRSASQVSIEALEDSEIFLLHPDDVQFLHHHIPALVNFSRLNAEEKYNNLLHRMLHVNNMSYTASQRLDYFEELYPQLMGRIPAYVVASFLGISDETYCRLRKKRNECPRKR